MKNKNEQQPLTWYDVTLKKFNQLKELDISDTKGLIDAAEILLGKEVLDMPASQLGSIMKRIEFLKEPIPEVIPPKHTTINGRDYDILSLLGDITTAQYIDFVNYCQGKDIGKMLSPFIVPKGHKYNDGYNMLEVFEDIEDLPLPLANSISFFFKRQWLEFTKNFHHCLQNQLKKTKIDKETKKIIMKTTDRALASVLYHT